MRSVVIMPAALAGEIPLPDADRVKKELAAARKRVARKIVVLDDDPTGIQTVHDVAVYTDWHRETLIRGLTEAGTMFFVLTNSRSFTAEETERAHREIAEGLAAASRETGVPFLLVSRETPPCGDTTPWKRRLCGGHWRRKWTSGTTARSSCPIFRRADG